MDLAHFWNTSGAYQINQSLRFDGSAYLSRSLGTTSSSWTVSFWTKTALNDNNDGYWFNTSQAAIYMDSSSGAASDRRYKFRDATSGSLIVSNAVIRDPSAWYHVVYKCDGSNRRLYVNNSLDAGFTYSGSTTLSGSSAIGAYYTGSGSQLEGYIAEFHFVDGTALDPSSFAETDTITGAWIPKKYTGSYGSQGFYLKFDPSATNGIGHDHSGNGNNFTATGFSTSGTGTDVMSDTPTNNYATLNPLFQASNLTNGNLEYNRVSANIPDVGTIALPANQGKWYWEIVFETTTGDQSAYVFGVVKTTLPRATQVGSYAAYQHASNTRRKYGTLDSGPTWSWSVGDVLGIGIDMTNGDFRLYQNGTLISNWTGAVDTNYDHYPFINGYYAGDKVTVNFGQRAFQQTPPSGHVALNTANLPEPTIKKGSKYFNTVLWTGNGSSQSITGVGFQPDLVWGKSRNDTYNHALEDSVRGVSRWLGSNSTIAETYTPGAEVTSFDTDGFSLGTGGIYNASSTTYVGWNWKAGGAGGSSNTAGTITSTVSANASAGFSIVSYTGTGSALTVGHGLGVAPSFMIAKPRSFADEWVVWHKAFAMNEYIYLNRDYAKATTTNPNTFWNNTAPTSTVISIGANSNTNANGSTNILYAFSEVAGYSKFGSYTGNGSSDGVFIHLGFKPAFFMWKVTSTTGSWGILDFKRDTYNVSGKQLFPNQSNAEASYTVCDLLSNGIKMRNTFADTNGSGSTYIFAAFAEHPFKYANAR